jgi:hypothetical protein
MLYLQAHESLGLDALDGVFEPVEISDATGKFLGVFIPANMELGKKLYKMTEHLFDLEEMKRLAASEKGGRTTAEILEDFRRMEREMASTANGVPTKLVAEGQPCVAP